MKLQRKKIIVPFAICYLLLAMCYMLFANLAFAYEPYPPSYGSNNSPPFFGSNNAAPRFGSNNTGRGGVLIDNPLGRIANDIPGLIGYVLNAARGIAGLIAALMIVVGAYQILFAAGDPAKFKQGRQTIIYALIGLAVVLLANVLVSIIREIVGSAN